MNKSYAAKESGKQTEHQKCNGHLIDASERFSKTNQPPAPCDLKYKVVVLSIDGGTLVDVELDGSATVGDILEKLGREGHYRVCTLLFDKRRLDPLSRLAPIRVAFSNLPDTGLSANATNYVTAVFWSADGLKEKYKFSAQELLLETRQSGLIESMCNGQKRVDYKFKPAGYTVRELKETGFSINELKQCRLPLSDLLAAGFTADECNAAGYDA